jgi:stage III sporulation protein AA
VNRNILRTRATEEEGGAILGELAFLQYLPDEVIETIQKDFSHIMDKITEIRLRVGKPIIIYAGLVEKILVKKASNMMIKKTIELISGYSLYAWEEELRAGFITLPGGCRVGIAGKVVVEDGKIKTISNISGVNMRIRHELKGCADVVLANIRQVGHMLIISPPGCGKTTLLRDIARQISDAGKTVAIVDERSEIAGSYLGAPMNDVGIRTDVLDRCPKSLGMTMLLRSMSPDVIVVDEIGSEQDMKAMAEIVNAGIKIICTVHGNSIDDIRTGERFKSIRGIFDNYIVLSARKGPGTIEAIYDLNFAKV